MRILPYVFVIAMGGLSLGSMVTSEVLNPSCAKLFMP